MKLHEYEDGPTGPGVSGPHNEEDVFCDAPTASSLPAGCKPPNQLDYFRQIIRAYQGRDEDVVKYVKKVKALMFYTTYLKRLERSPMLVCSNS